MNQQNQYRTTAYYYPINLGDMNNVNDPIYQSTQKYGIQISNEVKEQKFIEKKEEPIDEIPISNYGTLDLGRNDNAFAPVTLPNIIAVPYKPILPPVLVPPPTPIPNPKAMRPLPSETTYSNEVIPMNMNLKSRVMLQSVDKPLENINNVSQISPQYQPLSYVIPSQPLFKTVQINHLTQPLSTAVLNNPII